MFITCTISEIFNVGYGVSLKSGLGVIKVTGNDNNLYKSVRKNYRVSGRPDGENSLRYVYTCLETINSLNVTNAYRRFVYYSVEQQRCIQFLSVQCYAWTEYKFTCVSVCVSVTLSVNSPTGQTPQRISTVDSLKDADLRKDVPFGRPRRWIITFKGPMFAKTTILGAWISISSQIWEKFKYTVAISSDLCIRLIWNLTGSCGRQQRLRGWSRMVVKQFQDGGRPPFWKSIYRHISAKFRRNFVHSSRYWTRWTTRDQKWKDCIG